MVNNDKGFDIVLSKQCMGYINHHYQIDCDSNKMRTTNNLWEEQEEGQIFYLPGQCPLDVNKGIAQQAKLIHIQIIWKVELKNISAPMIDYAFLSTVHHPAMVVHIWQMNCCMSFDRYWQNLWPSSVVQHTHNRRMGCSLILK
jgi:hypothetical protein